MQRSIKFKILNRRKLVRFSSDFLMNQSGFLINVIDSLKCDLILEMNLQDKSVYTLKMINQTTLHIIFYSYKHKNMICLMDSLLIKYQFPKKFTSVIIIYEIIYIVLYINLFKRTEISYQNAMLKLTKILYLVVPRLSKVSFLCYSQSGIFGMLSDYL